MSRVKVIEMDFADVREGFLKARKEARWASQPVLGRLARDEWSKGSADQWTGGSGADTERWLRDGFNAESFALNELDVEPRMRTRAEWSEDDGDLDPGRLYGGCDDYLLTQAKREVMPGVTVEIEYDFSKSCPPKSIEQYGQWLARLLASLEAEGYDLGVVIVLRSMDLFANERSEARTDIRLVVKRPGEISNFTSWSAIFAPTGFRHLVFTAYGLAGDALSKPLANGLGGPVTSGWGCSKDEHVIAVTCDSRAEGFFPMEQLTNEAREAGILR